MMSTLQGVFSGLEEVRGSRARVLCTENFRSLMEDDQCFSYQVQEKYLNQAA